MNKSSRFFFLIAGLSAFSCVASAVPTLRITVGPGPGDTIDIADQGIASPGFGADSTPAIGQVSWIGSIGVWSFNIQVGTTFPIMGALDRPYLDLSFNSTSVSGLALNTLTLAFSADGWAPVNNAAEVSIGGTTPGSVTYATYGGTNNTLFSTANQLSFQGPFAPGAFSGTLQTATINSGLTYSLSQVVTITHGSGTAQTTGDVVLVAVPDLGSTQLLFGGSLAVLGLISWRRKFAARAHTTE